MLHKLINNGLIGREPFFTANTAIDLDASGTPLEMVKEAAESINKALTTLSQRNIVSANNAQPLQAVTTAIDVNVT